MMTMVHATQPPPYVWPPKSANIEPRTEGRIERWLHEYHPILVVFVVALSASSVSVLDAVTSDELSLWILYAIPVAAAGWRFGKRAAGTVATASLALRGLLLPASCWQHPFLTSWNLLLEGGLLLAVGGVAAHAHALVGRARALSALDSGSGVWNERALRAYLEEQLPRLRRSKQTHTLLYVHVDDLAALENRYHHSAVDEVMQALARSVAEELSADDHIARCGLDVFVAAINGPVSEVEPLLRRVRARVGRAIALPTETLRLSAGIARASEHTRTVDQLFAEAERDMRRFRADVLAASLTCDLADPQH